MSIATALSELSEKRKQIEEAAREQAKAILAPGLKEFMSAHPDVKAIGWAQYTPYFNDGDPCVFHTHGMHASASDQRSEDFYDDGWTKIWGDEKDGFTAQSWSDLKTLEKALRGAEPELLAAFGDHVRVIVTSDGIDVDEYSHDSGALAAQAETEACANTGSTTSRGRAAKRLPQSRAGRSARAHQC